MTTTFKSAKWDSDALEGNTYDELFKDKLPGKKHKSKLKAKKIKEPKVLQINKKARNIFGGNMQSNDTVRLIEKSQNTLTKSKKKRMKKLRSNQRQQNGNSEDEHKSVTLIKKDTFLKNRHADLNHFAVSSVPLKTNLSKEKKKQRSLKKKLELFAQNETLMNQVQIKSVVGKKQTKDSPNRVALTENKKTKFFEKLKHALANHTDKKPMPTLRQKMLDRLKAARFRFLNEQIYTTNSKEAQRIFQSDPEAFKTYHEGFQKQVKRWPMNPLDVITKSIKKMPKTHVIADFGCGDATLAKKVSQKVYSFDLVAVNETVTSCDMSNVPLEDDAVDVVVFCLSLMGTNLQDYLLEANRVLKIGGIMKIAEVESRFEDVGNFIKDVQHFGFKNTWKDLSNNLFYFLDFRKTCNVKNKKKLPTLSLLPCLYKKR